MFCKAQFTRLRPVVHSDFISQVSCRSPVITTLKTFGISAKCVVPRLGWIGFNLSLCLRCSHDVFETDWDSEIIPIFSHVRKLVFTSIRNYLDSLSCWRFIYFKISSKSSSTETSCVEMYSSFIAVMLFSVLNMDGTAGTQNHKPLALVKRLLSQWKSNMTNISNTVSAITYCNGTLYKVTIWSRNTGLIYKNCLKP